MNFFASFPRKLGHKVEKKGTRKFSCKKSAHAKVQLNCAEKKIKILATKQYLPLYGKPFDFNVKKGAYSTRCRSHLCKFFSFADNSAKFKNHNNENKS